MAIEDIFNETGGFGRFQLFIVLCIGLNDFTIGWSMLQMSFAGVVPEWFCQDGNDTLPQNRSHKTCYMNGSSSNSVGISVTCEVYRFEGSLQTIINQWNLICDLDWVKSTVTSVQMCGVLLGALLAGQLGDLTGRKKTLYSFVLGHAVLNFIAAFSVTWQMFAVCRFFIGLGIGGVIVSSFPYSMEFLPIKWRPLVSVVPIWSVGVCVFALASWIMQNWSYLHIACGILSIPGLLGYIYVPESLRWLTVRDRQKDAHSVVMKMATTNHKLQPRKASIMLQTVAWEEQKAHESDKHYTYLDLFNTWQAASITLIFCFHWFSISVAYYGISFGVANLAGNIHLNIFLLALVEIPPTLLTFYFSNRIGRKWTTIVSLAVACVPSFACVFVQLYSPGDTKTAAIMGLSLTAKMGVGAAWSVAETWCSEYYPTATRFLGFGAVNVVGCVGALLAPFLINLDDRAVASFIVMVCLLVLDIILLSFAPETKGLELTDTPANIKAIRDLHDNSKNADKTEEPHQESGLPPEDVEANQVNNSPKLERTVLGIVEEESSDDDVDDYDSDDKNSDTISENEAVDESDGLDVSVEIPDKTAKKCTSHENKHLRFQSSSETPSPRGSPALKLKKSIFKTDNNLNLKPESGSSTPSPRGSPALKLKKGKVQIDADLRNETGSSTPSPHGSPALKLKKGKVQIDADLRNETGSSTPSPNGSPALKLKKNKIQKDLEVRLETGSSTPSPRGSPALKLKKGKVKIDTDLKNETDSATPSLCGSPALKPKKTKVPKDSNLHPESVSATSSPGGSPALKPKRKRLDKLKHGDFLPAKMKPKQEEEFPPYIESSHNKNVRFSIY